MSMRSYLAFRAVRLCFDAVLRIGFRQPRAQVAPLDAKKVLVIRIDAIGDVVLTIPLLRELRRNLPAARIAILTSPNAFGLLETCPYVDEVLAIRPKTFGWRGTVAFVYRAIDLSRRVLWQQSFDLVLCPRWDVDAFGATWLAYLSGAPVRAGYSEHVEPSKARYNRYFDTLMTHVLDRRIPQHDVLRNIDLLRFLGGRAEPGLLQIWTTEEDQRVANRLLEAKGASSRGPLIALAVGAGHPRRMWPVSNFVTLAKRLIEGCGATIVVVGSGVEAELGDELVKGSGSIVVNVAGVTTLRQTAAILKRCKLIVTNDSGPLHLAAACGIPVLEVSCHPQHGYPNHPSSPVRFGPWGVRNTVLQPEKGLSPCSDACVSVQAHCISTVSLEAVLAAALRLLAHTRGECAVEVDHPDSGEVGL